MSEVRLEKVRKSFGPIEVIKGVTLDIPDGSFVTLVGPSGCGKSTLLRLIAGLEQLTSGQVRIGSRDVSHLPPKSRDISMVFQSYALYPHMDTASNMGFSLRLAKRPKSEIVEAVSPVAGMLGLEEYLGRLPKELSGGQRQRVAMGRAIVRHPKVFLFDEPLSNLDAKLRVHMRSEIRALHQRLQTTIIYVTHDQIEAMTMADLIVVLDEGKVSQVGNPLDLYDRPLNRFVAEFIGSPSMNMIEGRIDGGVFRSARGLVLSLPPGVEAFEGRPVVYGIRPHHLRVGNGDVEGAIQVVEQTGAETQVRLECTGEQLLAVSRERLIAQPGETISVSAPADSAHIFAQDTGERLETSDDKSRSAK